MRLISRANLWSSPTEEYTLREQYLRRLPCCWDGKTVVVGASGNEVNALISDALRLWLECLLSRHGAQVRVQEPYTPESAYGGDEKSLAHVRKVV
eukprot:COSAG05_NODE_5011_length_1292_cov_1.053646_1_plen_95_part_00